MIEGTSFERLSPTELRVALDVAVGRSTNEIAGQLGLSRARTYNALANAMAKLGLSNKVQLARLALLECVVEP